MSTLLCVPITVDDLGAAIAEANLARDAGADLVEFRIDELFHGAADTESPELIKRLVAESPVPCIITCRASAEGGAYDADDADRVALYEDLCTDPSAAHPSYIDVEFATYTRSANLRQKINLAVQHPTQLRDVSTGLILSAHDFDGRPANLFTLLSGMRREAAARILKLAWRARSLRDNLEVFDILTERDRPTIALAMGEFGLLSRVLAPKFGGFLTFASLRDSAATAPGQPTIRELLDLYRFRSINAATRVYGVIGWPVTQSMSPAIHNAGFEWLEGRMQEQPAPLDQEDPNAALFSGVYLPLPVPPEWEHFKATLAALLDYDPLHFRGASVTIPHKEHLLRFAHEDKRRRWVIDPIAERVGAANTLSIESDGTARVTNTDVAGVVGPLARALQREPSELSGVRVAIIGAGGAARASAFGLIDAGASVIICNRSQDRADQLVKDLVAAGGDGRAQSVSMQELATIGADAYINCTPIGMASGPDPTAMPFDPAALAGQTPAPLVFDTVYNPLETSLLATAKRQGLRVVPGIEMFVAQAAAQFELWTGLQAGEAPRSLFERVVCETLTPPQA